jgi:predicted nucleotidyltransferase
MSTNNTKRKKKELPIIRRNSKPRYWSSPFWNDNSVKDLIAEIIKPDDIDMSKIKVNDHLNPMLWDKKDQLKPEVRQALLKIAVEFIKYCKVENKKFNDVILVGSNASYNYTPQSDIDLHIITDFSNIDADAELIGEYFKAKKEMWALEHHITFDEHPIECYVQDLNEPNISSGVYSIMKDAWVRKPMRKFITVDEPAVQMKVADIVNKIDSVISDYEKGQDVTIKANSIKNKIKNMRKAGLYKEGEFSPENLAFKILRNTGYLDKLTKLKNDSFDREVSLDQPNKTSTDVKK